MHPFPFRQSSAARHDPSGSGSLVVWRGVGTAAASRGLNAVHRAKRVARRSADRGKEDRMMRRCRPGWLLVGLAYLGFVSIGLPDGLLGVAWPSIRASFGLPLDALGALLVMFTLGYLLSSFSSGRLLNHISVGSLLMLSCLVTALSLLGYA